MRLSVIVTILTILSLIVMFVLTFKMITAFFASSYDIYNSDIKQHPLYERHGLELHCRIPIKMGIAILGGSIEVPRIDGGSIKFTIPAGTQSGNKFRLKGKGMVKMNSKSHGDLYVHAMVETPVNLTDKQKELITEFSGMEAKGSSPKSEGFFDKIKNLFG